MSQPEVGATRRLVAEFVGTALLLATVVGSGVTATDGDAFDLLHHALAVGAVLAVLVLVLGPVSGAHLNPAVTAAATFAGELPRRVAAGYLAVQVGGAVTGVVAANVMFGLPALEIASVDRSGVGSVVGEGVATFGLLLTILLASRSRPRQVPAAVGAYVAGAILFTSSASFANPAVTIARVGTPTATGIAPAGLGGFLLGQLIGTVAAVVLAGWLLPSTSRPATDTTELPRSTS